MKTENGQSQGRDMYAEGFYEGVRQALQRCRLVQATGNFTATACITALEALASEPQKDPPPRFHCVHCARYFYSSPQPDRCPRCSDSSTVSAT